MKNERLKEINSKFETTWKYSAEIAKAADPFEGSHQFVWKNCHWEVPL